VPDALCQEHGANIAFGLRHSFGAALVTASACARAFDRLVLVGMIMPPRRDPAVRSRRQKPTPRRAPAGVWPGHPRARGWPAGALADRDRVFDIYLAEVAGPARRQVELACPPEIEAAIFEAAGSLDVLELASKVSVPALVLWARAGNFPYTHFETLAAQMPMAELRVADAGHLVPMENPELVEREVLRFVQRSTG
jgi:pimeloyl-ACP methyl ester carboxylesterase